VIALDVDAAPPAVEPERADQVGPVGVAEAGRAVVDVLHAAADAVLADHVPQHRRVLAVDVPDAVAIAAQLRQWIDEADDLVARLPLEADHRALHFAKHCVPGLRGMGDVAIPCFPRATGLAILKSQPHPLLFRAGSEGSKDLTESSV